MSDKPGVSYYSPILYVLCKILLLKYYTAFEVHLSWCGTIFYGTFSHKSYLFIFRDLNLFSLGEIVEVKYEWG